MAASVGHVLHGQRGEQDAEDARLWLLNDGVINPDGRLTGRMRS